MPALSFHLKDFDGPLDALLTLISKHKMNIYDIPIAELVEQYLALIEEDTERDLEVASEFLEMAARLVQIKTLMLLPKYNEDAEVMRQELTGQLIEYRIIKEIATKLREKSIYGDVFFRLPEIIDFDLTFKGKGDIIALANAYITAAGRRNRRLPPPVSAFSGIVSRHMVSVTSRMNYVCSRLLREDRLCIDSLYTESTDRGEIVATFLAVLELLKSDRVILCKNGTEIKKNTNTSDLVGIKSEMD